MTPDKPKDDLDAVRVVVEALKSFPEDEQKRIIKWACEKLGISVDQHHGDTRSWKMPEASSPSDGGASQDIPIRIEKSRDIKTFVESKNPKTDKHFAAVVAYYWQFEAEEKKDSITQKDLVDATRLANWNRLPRPDQTLVNATHTGLLDNISRGHYRLNSVGENLVAMSLPSNDTQQNVRPKKTPKKRRVSSKGKAKK